MGVAALHGYLISPIGHDHPGPPSHYRGRVTKAHPPFFGMPSHLGEPQLPGADRAEQFFPVSDLAAQHVDDEEVVGQYRAEQLMIGGKQSGKERFIARKDLAGADLLCSLHCFDLLVVGRSMQAPTRPVVPDSRLFRSHVVGGDGGGILTWPDTQMTSRDPANPEDG